MQIRSIHSYLTYPTKSSDEQPMVNGATVSTGTKLYQMLSDVLKKSYGECDIDISFNSIAGKQENPSRSLIISYGENPSLKKGQKIAEALQAVTTGRSGMGLLFLIVANDGKKTHLLISRFPADFGILAEDSGNQLSIEFVEKVFMKNAKSYKSALYQDTSFKTGFWDGKATDKQINSDIIVSEYWIKSFLQSDFKTTAEAGTRRFAVALRNACQKADDINIKSEIASAAQLVKGLPKQSTSINHILARFNFSKNTRDAIVNELANDNTASENFIFLSSEFTDHIQFRSIELDNGGRLVADAGNFDDVFHISDSDQKGQVRISTQGKIVDERLRKSK